MVSGFVSVAKLWIWINSTIGGPRSADFEPEQYVRKQHFLYLFHQSAWIAIFHQAHLSMKNVFSFRHTRLQKLHDSKEPPMAKRRGILRTSYCQLPEQDMLVCTHITHERVYESDMTKADTSWTSEYVPTIAF